MTNATPATEANRKRAEELVERHLKLLLDKDIDGWIALWDEQGVVEFPYSPSGYARRLEGRAAIYAHMKDYPRHMDIRAFSGVQVHPTVDPEVTLAEFTCEGRAVATGRPYNQSYICVIETRGGRIVRYREYWNPLIVLEAFGDSDAFKSASVDAHASASVGG